MMSDLTPASIDNFHPFNALTADQLDKVTYVDSGTGIRHGNAVDVLYNGTEERYDRIGRHALERDISDFVRVNQAASIVICGSGPSLQSSLPTIRRLVSEGAKIGSLNTSHDFLYDNGVRSDICAVTDGNVWVKDYVTPREGTTYFVASQVTDDTWNVFNGFDRRVIHTLNGYDDPYELGKRFNIDPSHFIAGGSTTGNRLFRLCQPYCMHFGHVILAGFDSSFTDTKRHVRPKKANMWIEPQGVEVGLTDPITKTKLPRLYKTNPQMLIQTKEFEEESKEIILAQHKGTYPANFRFEFIGEGLLPDWAALHSLHAEKSREDVMNYQP